MSQAPTPSESPLPTPEHFEYSEEGGVATGRLARPERLNARTFDSYAELRDTFAALRQRTSVHSVLLIGTGRAFCSGGDVHDIIGPLVAMKNAGDMKGLLAFTRMTGDLVKAMIACPQPIVAAVDGVCVGAGAILAMASALRFGTPRAKTAFLFTRVGLAGCDMGACAMLPRIIGQGRAAELLYSGRSMAADEGERWGFFNRLCDPADVEASAIAFATRLAEGPSFAHGMTKTMLRQEWSLGLFEAIESEAQAQALCMQTQDFERAYHAFVKKERPTFEGD